MAAQFPYAICFRHYPTGATGRDMALSDYFKGFLNGSWVNIAAYGGVNTLKIEDGNGVTPSADFALPGTTGQVFGIRMYVDSITEQLQFLSFLNSGGSAVFNCNYVPGTGLQIRRGTTVLGTAPTLPGGSFTYIEFEFWAADSPDGAIKVYYDGVERLNITGVDLTNTTGGIVTARFQSLNSLIGNVFYYGLDVVYAKEKTSQTEVERLGPIIPNRLNPTSTVSADFTPSAGSNHENVDENLCDGNTTYNESGVADDQDRFGYSDLVAGISGLVMLSRVTVASAPNGGAPLLAHTVEIDSVEEVGQSHTVGSTSYRTQATMFYLEPDDSPLSVAGINSLIGGYKNVV